jgi:hypothetical protein
MERTCAPDHDCDPVVARLVLDINFCPDHDPITALDDFPDAVLDLVSQVTELHGSRLSIVLGAEIAEGATTRSGRRSLIQLIHDDDVILGGDVDD